MALVPVPHLRGAERTLDVPLRVEVRPDGVRGDHEAARRRALRLLRGRGRDRQSRALLRPRLRLLRLRLLRLLLMEEHVADNVGALRAARRRAAARARPLELIGEDRLRGARGGLRTLRCTHNLLLLLLRGPRLLLRLRRRCRRRRRGARCALLELEGARLRRDGAERLLISSKMLGERVKL